MLRRIIRSTQEVCPKWPTCVGQRKRRPAEVDKSRAIIGDRVRFAGVLSEWMDLRRISCGLEQRNSAQIRLFVSVQDVTAGTGTNREIHGYCGGVDALRVVVRE